MSNINNTHNITATFTDDDDKVLATYHTFSKDGISDPQEAVSGLAEFIITEINSSKKAG